MTLLNVYVWPDHAARPQVCPGHATQALYTCGICTPFFFFFCLSCLCSKISFHCVVFENNVVVSVKAVDNLLSYGLLLEPTRTIANK